MRTPDDDGSGDGGVSSNVGDGFGAVTGDDLEGGFGDDDFSDDNTFDDSFGDDTGASDDSVDTGDGDSSFDDSSDTDTSGSGDTPFGDGLSDAEAENVLVEILEDVFGADAPDVLDTTEADSGGEGSDVFEALTGSSGDDDGASSGDSLSDAFGDDGATSVVDDPFDPFEPAEIPSDADFDFTGDGHVDVHDLHEAAHPFDFDVTE